MAQLKFLTWGLIQIIDLKEISTITALFLKSELFFRNRLKSNELRLYKRVLLLHIGRTLLTLQSELYKEIMTIPKKLGKIPMLAVIM